MVQKVNPHCTSIHFAVDEWVWLRLQPYKHKSVAHQRSYKLAKRFYGPFRAVARIREVAYKLKLPSYAQIHDVFNVSLLKKFFRVPAGTMHPLPTEFDGPHPLVAPVSILDSHFILSLGRQVSQVLVL
ncbi:hypothetical protein Scep_017267 [Stephania cephalantha]|uniref:Tf2-1-like SH3-like domain-containing protein n=1 Tax=Stephania cephalantha TaxID=152367 RepID=A0AAP0IP49_9MAGN